MQPIQYVDREKKELLQELVASEGILKWLYFHPLGKAALMLLFKRKFISSLAGRYMNTRYSARRIEGFIKEHKIDMGQFEHEQPTDYPTFNQFFYRKLKPGKREIADGIVSPADGKILVFPTTDLVHKFFIKGVEFTIESFLNNKDLSRKYHDGAMAIIRLAPADYHRFHFPASGKISSSVIIKGDYYSVSPIALGKSLEIFCQNKREYCTLETADYGDILYSEVGATLVGSIIQTYIPDTEIKKGDEKGYFAFGGSTIVLLFEKNTIQFDTDLIENTNRGLETTVKVGETIAIRAARL